MADNTKNSGLQSLPPKEAKANMNLNYLKDPVFGSPEYDTPEIPSSDKRVTKEEFEVFSANSEGIEFSTSTKTTVENDQNIAISKFITPDVGGTAIKAAEVTGEIVTIAGGATLDILNEMGIDLEKIFKGKTLASKEKTPEDQQREMANKQNIAVVQRAVQEAGQISDMRDQKDNHRLAGDKAASLSNETQTTILHLQKKEKLSKKDMVDLRNALIEQERQQKMQQPSPFTKVGKGLLSSQRANQNEAPEGGGALATVTRGPQ